MTTLPTYRGRFAPSPTGPLHFGSLVAAVASWLDARAHGGEWLVRIEDVDVPRTAPGAADDIVRTLEALGLSWDGSIVRQSDRTERYRQALEELRLRGFVYRCRCSRREIADSAVRGVDGMVYPGTCRTLALGPEIDGADRLRVPEGIVEFTDRVMGRIAQDVRAEIGDFVLRRRDGLFAYQLAVVVDDAEQGITDIVRGADLMLSTPRQIVLQRALRLPQPRYLHVPVATTPAGEKLSKQTGASPVDPQRAPALLGEALRFLGQRVPEPDTPAAMLKAAVAGWKAAQIPCREALPATFGDGAGGTPKV